MSDDEGPAEIVLPTVVSPPPPVSGDNKSRRPRRVTKRVLKKVDKERKKRKDDWRRQHLTPLKRLVEWGVPSTSLQLYGRWWQLERWLRDLVQLELQAAYQRKWLDLVAELETKRTNQVQDVAYMPSSDDCNPLGFADIGNLASVFDAHWDIFSYALPPKKQWPGTLNTLKAVRHRIAHCRAAHVDDLARVEQALRDLEHGARRCCGRIG